MLYPTISDLTKDKFNRYELAIATAKCARLITDEYVRQREVAEKSLTGNKETDKPIMSMIDREFRDEKAVKNAIARIKNEEYKIVRNKITEGELEVTDEVFEETSAEVTEE